MKKSIQLSLIFALLVSACTFPTANSTDEPSPEEIAQTMVAQTQTAQEAAATPTLPPPTNTAAPTATVTPSVPTVSVSIATNCRTGPDVAYPLVMVLQPGTSADVVGKYTATNYWIIKTPTDGTCWLWGEYATLQGDTATLPEMAAPPAPEIAEAEPTETPEGNDGGGIGLTPVIVVLVPAAPQNFAATAECQYLVMGGGQKLLTAKTDTLTWSSSVTATGYKIYVNGAEQKDLGGGAVSTSFDALDLKPSNYGIAAYNANGTSQIKTIPVPSCQ